ncbi:MAG: GNAT family N-acetyltransferase [Chloroflexota bacterium]
MTIEIRPLTTLSDIEQVRTIQMETWSFRIDETIPGHTLHALQNHGSCLLGAVDGNKVVGFVLGVLGVVKGKGAAAERLKMYSVAAGMLPDYQKLGLGYRLKLAQRDFALELGLKLITWTYDPLESLNGRFNITKLRAICNTYHRNYHGDMSGINAGLPTDRFEAEWWIDSKRVTETVSGSKTNALSIGTISIINPTHFNNHNLPIPPNTLPPSPLAPNLLLEIPANFHHIKQTDPALAKQWRFHTRTLFEHLFDAGYTMTDFVQDKENQLRSFYLLTT